MRVQDEDECLMMSGQFQGVIDVLMLQYACLVFPITAAVTAVSPGNLGCLTPR